MGEQPDTASYDKKLERLVKEHIKPLGVEQRIIEAFQKVPRHEFIPNEYKDSAYEDNALPIGEGQTISQPSLVALMTASLGLSGNEKVLEIGAGSGYQAAILSGLAKEVFTVERVKKLVQKAKNTLERLGYDNVRVYEADGTLGLPKYAPFDGIIVTAGAKDVPESLENQLKEGGRMVIPVGKDMWDQRLMVGQKNEGKLELTEVEPVRFVPLIGEQGWRD
jgi:protein-L-isoaspartate(D-aspartate) O-methyltransferase